MPQASNPFKDSSLYSLEFAVIIAICLIALVTVIFFLITCIMKINRVKESKLKDSYQEKIDIMLFDFIFSEKSTNEIIESSSFQNSFKSPLFQRVAIKSLIALHHNYTGIYSNRLEKFYAESGLCNYSLRKLNSTYWPDIVESIRDLSTLNYQKAYSKIATLKLHKNNFVIHEALLGTIKLKGITEILKFKNTNFYLNDWLQSNILFYVKKYNISAPPNILILLESKNPSMVLLAVRLINHYNIATHYNSLSAYYQETKDLKLKQEISIVLKKTEQLY